jgi:hypothetical protein
MHKIRGGEFGAWSESYLKHGWHVLTPDFDKDPMAVTYGYELPGTKKMRSFLLEAIPETWVACVDTGFW